MPKVRPQDVAEVCRLTHYKDFRLCVLSIIVGYEDPIYKLVHEESGDVVGFGGFDPDGCVWLVLTNDYNRHKISFLRWGKWYLAKVLLKKFPHGIFNTMWIKNKAHYEFLKWFGAEFQINNYDNELLDFWIGRDVGCAHRGQVQA